jgi:hypothetical protein
MSYTTSYTFTRSNAEYVASKVVTDLKLMQIYLGAPDDEWIEKYRVELVELMAGGYLSSVTYGFKHDGNWLVALRYEASLDGSLSTDDRAGKVAAMIGTDVKGLGHSSYLITSANWDNLPLSHKTAIRGRIGFDRVGAAEPGTGMGYWSTERTYSSNGGGVTRQTLKRQ